jgi:peptide/nickel transport system substrate-binding protein
MNNSSILKIGTIVVVFVTVVMFFSPVTMSRSGNVSQSFLNDVSSNNTSSGSAFYLAVDSYGSFTPNLNPFSGIASSPYQTTALSLVYQPLMYLMNGENPQPAVATSYSYSSNLTNVTFTLKSGLEYNNGASLNVSDVIFSFHYVMDNSKIDSQGLSSFIKSVARTGPEKVSFYLDNTAYTNLYRIMSQPIIFPGQWINITSPYSTTITNPIGTGPFVATSISSSQFEFKWNSYYPYSGKHLSEIIIPSYPTVTAEANALTSGNINWLSGAFDADAPTWATQSSNHFYFTPPSGFFMLYLNNMEWPLSNVSVRTAIAFAVNRETLSNESLQPPAGNFVIPALNNYLEPSMLAKYSNGSYYNYNLSYASKILTSAGFTKNGNGYWAAKNGTVLSITLSGNGAASNVVANLNTMKLELDSFGIKTSVYTPSGSIFYANVYDGNYSAGLAYLASSINPIGALNESFSSYWNEPIGTSATGDYSRFNNSNVTTDINLADQQTTLSGQREYINKAVSILLNDTPSIPLAMTISQNEFNTKGYAGINQTSFKDALLANGFGLISIAVPILSVYSTLVASHSPLSILDYGVIAIVIVAILAATGYTVVKRRKKEE